MQANRLNFKYRPRNAVKATASVEKSSGSNCNITISISFYPSWRDAAAQMQVLNVCMLSQCRLCKPHHWLLRVPAKLLTLGFIVRCTEATFHGL